MGSSSIASDDQGRNSRLPVKIWRQVKNFSALGGDATYLWPRWMILRAVGLVCMVVFAGIIWEGQALVGPRGLAPLSGFFEQLTEAVPNPVEAFFQAPSLFWLDTGAGMISLVAWAGMLAAVALVLNLWPRMALFCCWVAVLSFITTFRAFTQTQVDQLILEATLLCIPFAPAGLRPGLGIKSPPRPIVILMLRLFLLRVMLETGLMKIFYGDAHWRDLTAMDVLYETTPFPTFFGYLDHQMPHIWHAGEAVLTFLAEIVAPVVAVFGGRRGRWLAIATWTAFQAGIQLTNNFGWLNTTSIALGLVLLDDQMIAVLAGKLRLHGLAAWLKTKSPLQPTQPVGPWRLYGLRAALWVHLYFSLVVAGIDFCGWPADDFLNRPLRSLLARFQSANAYSLFAAFVPFRTLIEFEGSNDGGQTWRPYEYVYQAQREDQIPPFIAPYYARFESTLQAEALKDTPSTIYELTAVQLLQREPDTMKLFRGDPFADHPAGMIRVPAYHLSFTDFATYRKTGHFWRKESLGIYLPTMYLNEQDEVATIRSATEGLIVMATQGNAAAQNSLGVTYATGGGVPKDSAEAAKWFRLAAIQGNADAQLSLGYMYSRGEGVAPNKFEAVDWFRRAAMQGNEGAQFLLGMSYSEGNGVTKDDTEALAWLFIAIQGGSKDAAKNRDIIELFVSPGTIMAARQRAESLQAEIENRRKSEKTDGRTGHD